MNASARRDDLLACLGYTVPQTARTGGRLARRRSPAPGHRPSALGWMLLTGLACGSPLPASAADWLAATKPAAAQSASQAGSPATLSTQTAPNPPLPPSPPAESAPAAATAAATAATPPAAAPTAASKTPSETSVAAAAWQTITGWLSPSKTGADTSPRPGQTGRPTAASAATARPVPATAAGSAAPATRRFDPGFGLAGLAVSDAEDRSAAQTTQQSSGQSSRSDLEPQPIMPRSLASISPEPEESAVATDEPVSLVSWLSSYATGGHGGHAEAFPGICLSDTCCPTWEAQVDALFLWQGNIPSRPLYIDSATGATVLDANQLSSPAAIAPRYALTYHRDDCRAIEVNYFQVWGFNAQQAVGPRTDAFGDGALTANNLVGPDYNQVSGALVTSSANIQSLEVNLRRTDGGMIEWISGFRWLEWGQNLTLADSITTGDTLVGGDIARIDTLNSLYGWQWGGDMMLWNAGRWLRVNGIAKAGVYYNHQASQNTFYTDFFNPDVNASSSDDTVSFVGETGVNASLALTNWLSWRAGYTFFWLGGMATPARQLGLTDISTGTTSVNTNGSVMLHGVNTGLEARW